MYACCHAVNAVQVSLLLEQADQYDESANAALKGIRAEPQQPELPRLRQALGSVQKVVLLAESQDVSGSPVATARRMQPNAAPLPAEAQRQSSSRSHCAAVAPAWAGV